MIWTILCLALAILPGDVSSFQLGNGITVVSRWIPGEVEGLSVFLIGGTRLRDQESQGLEAMALEAALAGGGNFPGERWRELMDRTRAELSGSYNYDFSRIHLRCLTEDLPLLAEGLAECLSEPELSEESVERVRRQAVSQLSLELVDPDQTVWLAANQGFMPRGHPYLLRPQGTVATASSFSAEDLRNLLEQRVRAGNVLITHAGPTEPGALMAILEEWFGTLPAGGDALPEVAYLGAPRDTVTVWKTDATTTYAVVKFSAPPAGHPDQPGFQAAMMVADELLWQVLRTDNALTYASGAGATVSYTENWGYMHVTTSQPHTACSLMTEVLQRVAEGDVEPELINGVIRTMVTAEGMQAQRMDTQCYLLGAGTLATGDWRVFLDAAERFGDLSPRDLSAALRKWADTASWGIVTGNVQELDIIAPIPLGIHRLDHQGLLDIEGGMEVLFPGSKSETVILTDSSTGIRYALVGQPAGRLVEEGAAGAHVLGELTREGWAVREDLPKVMVMHVLGVL